MIYVPPRHFLCVNSSIYWYKERCLQTIYFLLFIFVLTDMWIMTVLLYCVIKQQMQVFGISFNLETHTLFGVKRKGQKEICITVLLNVESLVVNPEV